MLDDLTTAAEASDDKDGTELASEARPVVAEVRRPHFGPFFWTCTAWLGFLMVVTVFANLLPLRDPINGLDSPVLPDLGSSGAHWLGTDDSGRDILSRVIYGARVSLVIGVCATIIGVTIGGLLGMLAAYLRGRFDGALSLVMYTGLAFPAIVAVLAILSFWKPSGSELHIIVVLGLFSVPLIYRLVRAATLACATKEYVTAAKSQGATARRVILKDIFPNIAPALIAYTVFTLGGVIATEGALAFLGYSVAIPTPSWGNMIGEASNLDQNNIYLLLAPAIGLFLTLISLNYIGERIRTHFDTAESKL